MPSKENVVGSFFKGCFICYKCWSKPKLVVYSLGSSRLERFSLCGHWYITSLSFIYYALLDLRPTYHFETPYIEVKFVVFLENLSEPLLVSTQIGDSMIGTWVYNNSYHNFLEIHLNTPYRD